MTEHSEHYIAHGTIDKHYIEQETIYIYTLLCIFHYVLSQDTHTHTRLVTKSYPTLCDPLDWSPPGSSVHGIFQARVLEWVAISFCRVSSRSRDQNFISCIAGEFFTVEPPE